MRVLIFNLITFFRQENLDGLNLPNKIEGKRVTFKDIEFYHFKFGYCIGIGTLIRLIFS